MKKKLNLNDLKVKSFITTSAQFDAKTVQGGRPPVKDTDNCPVAHTDKIFCGGDQPNGGETILNICETVYYGC